MANDKPKVPKCIKDGWFSEVDPGWAGQKLSIALEGFSDDSILFHEQTQYQDILVFRSAQHGNVLVLDGVLQLTESDEFVYQEMITHIPMMVHPRPLSVLVVGGGDGGVIREVCKHSCVEKITLVEIDQKVIDVAKKFLGGTLATSFDDPRLTIVMSDAAEFLQQQNLHGRQGYDIIVADSSDPVGPAETLFDPSFYEQMYEALNNDGIMCSQGECFWTQPDLVCNVIACCEDIFDNVSYASTSVPTVPTGQIGFIVASKGENVMLHKPSRDMSPELQQKLKWYTPSVHRAAFALPRFLEEKLGIHYNEEYDSDDGEDNNECFLKGCTIS